MWRNISASVKCPKCGGELIQSLGGWYCPPCDRGEKPKRKSQPKADFMDKADYEKHKESFDKYIEKKKEKRKQKRLNKIIKPIPKITYKYPQALKSKQDAQKVEEAVNEDQRLSLNATQEYRTVDRGNQVVHVASIFGQDYTTISTRGEEGLQNSSIPDGSWMPPTNPPVKPGPGPVIPPTPTPGPGPFPGPIDDEPIPPVIPPGPETPHPIPIPKPQIPNCIGVPILTVSVTNTTMNPGTGQAITTTGGGGSISMTIDDPCNNTVPDQTSSGYITISPTAANVDCLCNITITVTDDCGQSDSITIGINTLSTGQAYLVPGSVSQGQGDCDWGSMCCETFENWQYCDGHIEQSSYKCFTCASCSHQNPIAWESLCPGTNTCQNPYPPGWKETLEAQGCCPGS